METIKSQFQLSLLNIFSYTVSIFLIVTSFSKWADKLSPFSLLGALLPLSVRAVPALVSTALLVPALWLVPPLSAQTGKKHKPNLSTNIMHDNKKRFCFPPVSARGQLPS